MCLADDLRCFGIATAVEHGAEQIAYATPISSVLSYFRNWWTPGTCVGEFPRWGFTLTTNTTAFAEAVRLPRALEGAVVAHTRKSADCGGLKTGDVLLSIHRDNTEVRLDRFGMIADESHGQPRFAIGNLGFIASLNRHTRMTVWRPSLKKTKVVQCAPVPPLAVEKPYHQGITEIPFTLLGSCVLMNATPDFLQQTEVADSDEEGGDGISALATFHVLAKLQAQKKSSQSPNHVVVLSHFHQNAYVSSLRALSPGDIICQVNGITLKSTEHAEQIVKRAAVKFATQTGKAYITLTTPDKTVYLSLQKLLQEETLVLPERPPAKLHLLAACANASATSGGSGLKRSVRQSRRLRRRREERSVSTAKLQTVLEMQGGSPTSGGSCPGSPARKTKRRRSSRLAHTYA